MRLSLNFCNIDSFGSKYLQEILAYVESQLWSLKLRGNFLRNILKRQIGNLLDFLKLPFGSEEP